MAKLGKLSPKVATIAAPAVATPLANTAPDGKPQAERLRGRANQARRFRLWRADPHCAKCGRFVGFTSGEFEVDHIEPLEIGGADTDENCQILCVYYDETGKHGCHMDKSNADNVSRGADRLLGTQT